MMTHEQYIDYCKNTYQRYRDRHNAATTHEEQQRAAELLQSAAVVLAEAITQPAPRGL